jgi:hypothetical protein
VAWLYRRNERTERWKGEAVIIRICTEDKNEQALFDLTSEYFTCFSITKSIGSWNGSKEPALTIDLAVLETPGEPIHRTELKAERNAHDLATRIKLMNKQEAVLIEHIVSNNVLV